MKRAIAWFAENHVAANLLMFGILAAGLLSVPNIKQTVFPDFDTKYISATVVYPGSSPEDIEKEREELLKQLETNTPSEVLEMLSKKSALEETYFREPEIVVSTKGAWDAKPK